MSGPISPSISASKTSESVSPSRIGNALTIAGSDSGGGAGIQADLKSFSANRAYGASVITAITAQNTCAVIRVETVSPAMIRAQIAAVLDDIRIDAIKIGMLGTPETIEAVADGLKDYKGPIVLDPVMVSKSGDALLQNEAVSCLIERLLPYATLLTPNIPEAQRLIAASLSDSSTNSKVEALDTDPTLQAKALMALGPEAVLMKGGHAEGAMCRDLLVTAVGHRWFEAPRLPTRNTHGTGCSISSAIAAGLANGMSLEAAVGAAHHWLQGAILAADRLEVGAGHGPVHHFHNLWR